MSTMALKLPSSFVDVEREEMEYVDGGATYSNYWWGYAVNLNSNECGTMSDLLAKKAAVATFIGVICAFIPDITISKAAVIACAISALTSTWQAIELNTANREGKGATLTCVLGVDTSVSIW